MVACLVFIIATSFRDSFWPKKTVARKKVHLAITFSKLRLDVHAYIRSTSSSSTGNPGWSVSCEAW